VVIVTSNAEKELPDAFLRRCVFHFIEFPDPAMMEEIVKVHFPDIRDNLLREALKTFYRMREIDDLRKKPSTAELVDWIQALIAGGIPADQVFKETPFIGTLLKKETDCDYFMNKFMNKRQAGKRNDLYRTLY
jgi:MoxR-like ATPase